MSAAISSSGSFFMWSISSCHLQTRTINTKPHTHTPPQKQSPPSMVKTILIKFPDDWATTKQACGDELLVYLSFSSPNIYIALLLCIEHCFTKVKILHFIYIYIYICIYRISSPISRVPKSWRRSNRLVLSKRKSKTIGYKPRAKFLIITGHLSERTSPKKLGNGSMNTKANK